MNLLQSLQQHAQAVAAQINPFDNGRTYNTVMTKGAQYAPQAPSSVVQQATHNGVTNAAGQVAQNFVNVPMAAVNMGRGMFDQFATDNQTAAQRAYGQALNDAHNNVVTGIGHQLAGFGQAGADLFGKQLAATVTNNPVASNNATTAFVRDINKTPIGQVLNPVQHILAGNQVKRDLPQLNQAQQKQAIAQNLSNVGVDPKATLGGQLLTSGMGAAQLIVPEKLVNGVPITQDLAAKGAKIADTAQAIKQSATPLNEVGALNPKSAGSSGNETLQHADAMNNMMFAKSVAQSPADIAKARQSMNNLEGMNAQAKADLTAARKNQLPNDALPPSAGKQPLPSVPAGNKNTRFATVTVQKSDQVTPLTKTLVAEKDNSYTPQAMQAGMDSATRYANRQSIHKATADTLSALQPQAGNEYGHITRQDAFNAQAVADRLQSTGKAANAGKAADIYAQLSQHYRAGGQLVQAAAALARQSPQGMMFSAMKHLTGAKVDITPVLQEKLNAGLEQYKAAQTAFKNAPKGTDMQPLADNQAAAYQNFINTVNKALPRTKMQAAASIWRAGLLTGPETAAKVTTSHIISAPVNMLTRPFTAAADAATSSLTPRAALKYLNRNNAGYKIGDRTSTFAPIQDLKNAASGAARGMKATGIKLKTGVDLPNTGGFETDFGKSPHQSLYEQAPFRLHGAIMKTPYSAAYKMDLADQARTTAGNMGLKGADKQAYIDNFMKNPSAAAQDVANHYAEHFSNMQHTAAAPIASALQRVQIPTPFGQLPIGQYIVPFTRIPTAIAAKGIVDWTPLGITKAGAEVIRGIRNGNFDQRAFSQAIGRSTAGTLTTTAVGYELMRHGNMTLAAPADPKERALWQTEGKQPNSIKIGGKWISLNAFGPAGISMGLGGAYGRSAAQGGSLTQNVATSIASAGRLVADQPYLKGISGMANALNDPGRYATTFLNSTVGSIIPAAVSQTARGTDSQQRAYPTTIPSTLQGEIPGLREGLPAQSNLYGQTMPGPGGSIGKDILGTINPFYPSQPMNTNDPATSELQRLYDTQGSGGTPAIGAPQKKMVINGQKTKLTPEQYQQYMSGSGPLIHQGINNLVQNPQYQSLSDQQKANQINSVIEGAHTAQKVNLLGDNPKSLSLQAKQALADPNSLGNSISINGFNINANLDQPTKQLLTQFATMSSDQRNKTFATNNSAQYQYDSAQFQNKLASGSLTTAQRISGQQSLAKSKVGANYSQDVRQIYGLSKSEISGYLQGLPTDQANALYGQLYQYGQDLKNGKFETNNKIATLFDGSGSGGGSGKKAATAFDSSLKRDISATSLIAKKASGMKIKKPSLSSKFASKSSTSSKSFALKPVRAVASTTKTKRSLA